MERMYTIKELEDILCVQPDAIRDFLVQKRIPFIKVGKGYWISEWDLKDFREPKNLKIETEEQGQ